MLILPRDLKIWVSERKPKMSTETADMADNYGMRPGAEKVWV